MCHSFNPASKQAVISEALCLQSANRLLGSCACVYKSEAYPGKSYDPDVLIAEYSACSGANTGVYGFKRTTADLVCNSWHAYRQEMLYYFWQANQEMDGII